MEKQTEIDILNKVGINEFNLECEKEGLTDYAKTRKAMDLSFQLGQIQGQKESRQGMIKIEDVNKMIDEKKWLEQEPLVSNRVRYIERHLTAVHNNQLDELKQSLRELGDK
jgi:hypothetical protein